MNLRLSHVLYGYVCNKVRSPPVFPPTSSNNFCFKASRKYEKLEKSLHSYFKEILACNLFEKYRISSLNLLK